MTTPRLATAARGGGRISAGRSRQPAFRRSRPLAAYLRLLPSTIVLFFSVTGLTSITPNGFQRTRAADDCDQALDLRWVNGRVDGRRTVPAIRRTWAGRRASNRLEVVSTCGGRTTFAGLAEFSAATGSAVAFKSPGHPRRLYRPPDRLQIAQTWQPGRRHERSAQRPRYGNRSSPA
jgi:hypothetical protein